MAVLHKKEEKIQAVLGRLPKKYTDEAFVSQFIQLYPRDWGKIKAAYIKQSQDREEGAIIHMPKPDLYLKQILTSFIQKNNTTVILEEVIVKTAATESKIEAQIETAEPIKKPKAAVKKKIVTAESAPIETKKNKANEKTETIDKVKKPKAVTKKKVLAEELPTAAAKKVKVAAKK